MVDLTTARLLRVPEHLRSALALVAVGAPVPLALLEEAVGSQVEERERVNLIRVSRDADDPIVTQVHPLYGELLKRCLTVTQTRDANRSREAHRRRTSCSAAR